MEESNFIKSIDIINFKSILNLHFSPKKYNIFIGEPNVGKSNILEAISMLSPFDGIDKKFQNGIVRYQDLTNLFYNDDTDEEIKISSDKIVSKYNFNNDTNSLEVEIINEKFKIIDHKVSISNANPIFQISAANQYIKKYHFTSVFFDNSKHEKSLIAPNGTNIFKVVNDDEELKNEISSLLVKQNLDFVLYKKEGKFEIEKRSGKYIYKYPYSSIADTYQRYIFYLAAIKSNQNSVIILEEPEVHSFPPIVKDLAEEILMSENNQFFVSTHSPYFLFNFIENCNPDDLNICLTYFEDNQTKVKILSRPELQKIMDYNIDVFFNLESLRNG